MQNFGAGCDTLQKELGLKKGGMVDKPSYSGRLTFFVQQYVIPLSLSILPRFDFDACIGPTQNTLLRSGLLLWFLVCCDSATITVTCIRISLAKCIFFTC